MEGGEDTIRVKGPTSHACPTRSDLTQSELDERIAAGACRCQYILDFLHQGPHIRVSTRQTIRWFAVIRATIGAEIRRISSAASFAIDRKMLACRGSSFGTLERVLKERVRSEPLDLFAVGFDLVDFTRRLPSKSRLRSFWLSPSLDPRSAPPVFLTV